MVSILTYHELFQHSASKMDSINTPRWTFDPKIDVLPKKFETKYGRKLRVAHIGNIANNAYLGAREQRRFGVDAFCISPSYLHVMAFPEWDEISFEHETSHFTDSFPGVDETFARPNWFLSGDWSSIVEKYSNLQDASPSPSRTSKAISKLTHYTWLLARPIVKMLTPKQLRSWVTHNLLAKFRRLDTPLYTKFLNEFDILHFYGPYNYIYLAKDILPPMFSTEHGTLREYANNNFDMSLRSKRAYINSKFVFITNQDSFGFAKQIGINEDHFEFSPHPTNEDMFPALRLARQENLKAGFKSVEILVPCRQVRKSKVDSGKGNEIFLEAVKIIRDEALPVKFKMPLWGDHVDESLEVIKNSNLEDFFEFIPLLSRAKLKEIMVQSLAVIDQFNIEAYGGIGVDSLGVGVPLISAHSCANDLLAFSECAPLMYASSPSSIVENIKILIENKSLSEEIFLLSTTWYDKNLSMTRSRQSVLSAYFRSLNS
jgi:glycosyltransferase involved in cell wall biosynthesis